MGASLKIAGLGLLFFKTVQEVFWLSEPAVLMGPAAKSVSRDSRPLLCPWCHSSQVAQALCQGLTCTEKETVEVHACHPRAQEAEAGGLL